MTIWIRKQLALMLKMREKLALDQLPIRKQLALELTSRKQIALELPITTIGRWLKDHGEWCNLEEVFAERTGLKHAKRASNSFKEGNKPIDA
jgi:hypothetical protein